MNNPEIPVGTTVHIEPEDIKWRDNGDLISRSALKKAITEQVTHTTVDGHLAKNKAIQLIDNAPTVDLTKNQAYDKGFITAMKLYSRPQGEWILVDDTEKFIVKCSVCGRTEDSRMVKFYPFCHCGARMKGDDNE